MLCRDRVLSGIQAGIGVLLGTLIWATATAFGLGALVSNAPTLYVAIQFAGAAYLVWLGCRMIGAAWKNDYDDAQYRMMPRKPGRAIVLEGFLVNMTNPKTIAYYTSLFAVLISGQRSRLDVLRGSRNCNDGDVVLVDHCRNGILIRSCSSVFCRDPEISGCDHGRCIDYARPQARHLALERVLFIRKHLMGQIGLLVEARSAARCGAVAGKTSGLDIGGGCQFFGCRSLGWPFQIG